MIVTLTANPAIDRTISIGEPLQRNAVHRASGTRDQPGGKGINVSRALRASGVPTVALFPAAHDDPFAIALRGEGIQHVAVPIEGRVRTNIAITEADGTTTKLNEPGPTLGLAAREHVVDAVVEACRGASWLVLAGSLPPADPPLRYARVIEAVRARLGDGAPRIAVDTSGAPLRDVLRSGLPVDLIKPNAHELAELLNGSRPAREAGRGGGAGGAGGGGFAGQVADGQPLDGDALESDLGTAVEAARRALDFGCGAVLLTLGGAGAVYTDASTALVAAPPPISVASTVGAGDASLAGFLLAHSEGASPAGALAQAVAHGAAAASLPGSTLPARDQTHPDDVQVADWGASGTPPAPAASAASAAAD
ncbi:MAG: 1-phosphofructokinase family hexose kinase [Pseudoclavibacter sp.]